MMKSACSFEQADYFLKFPIGSRFILERPKMRKLTLLGQFLCKKTCPVRVKPIGTVKGEFL